MTQFVENLMNRASKLSKTIALAEGFDVRAAKAAEILTSKGVCKVVLIGNEAEIKAKFPDINFTGVLFDDPATSEHRQDYADTLYELRGLLALYPYYQSARLLLLQSLFLLHDPSFNEELRQAALYITDRKVIFNLVEAAHYQLPKPTASDKHAQPKSEQKEENK